MAQRTIYLPDDLDAAVKATGINASQVCQAALRHEVDLATARTLTAGVVAADGTPPSAARRVAAVEQPIEVDCTSSGRPVWPAGYRTRHVGPVRRLGYARVCDACGQAV